MQERCQIIQKNDLYHLCIVYSVLCAYPNV